MKAQSLLIEFCLVILAACASSAPSTEAINTAIAQTEAAKPTSTKLPTDTPAPTATATATITASPSPTPDIRVIDIDPRKLLLEKSDLPAAGKYYLPSGWMSPLTNAEIVAEWTVEEGKAYLAETGRIHGWKASYQRGTNGAALPDEYYDNVVIYSTSEGAQLIITKYGISEGESAYKQIDAPQVGDLSIVHQKTETDASGGTRVWFRIAFSYRNVYHTLILYGWETEVSLDLGLELANKLVDDLKQLPLSDTVEFSP